MMLVVMELLDSLSLLQPVPRGRQELLAFGHRLGHSSHARVPGLIGADGWRIAAIDHPKWRVVQRGLVRRVVDVLSPWQLAEPLTWAVAGEAPQVHGDDAVGCLCLAI